MEPMAQSGWYPDPDGGEPRYWDGGRWADNENGPPAPRPLWPLIAAVLSATLAVVLLMWQPWRGNPWSLPTDTNSASPTGRQWDEVAPSKPPTSPQPTDGLGRPVACPIVSDSFVPPQGDWYVSGPMKYKGVPGWRRSSANIIDYTSERVGQDNHVIDNWIAVTAIGQLSKADYSRDAKTAAMQIISCMSTSYYYSALESIESLEDRAYTTNDGVTGWLMRVNFWNVPGTYRVKGDEVVVLVLETGSQSHFTLFHTEAPIGDDQRKNLVADSLASLQRS